VRAHGTRLLGELRTAVDAEMNTVAGCAMSSPEYERP